jgi:uncharacterized membrane protein
MKKDKAHLVAFIGVMFALMFVLFLLETTLLAPVGMTACVLSLPVAVTLSIYDDWKGSFIGGTLLGVCSCICCLIFTAYIDYANPLISILPRMLLGVTSYWTYFGLSKLFKNSKKVVLRESLPATVAGIVGSITNTVLYLTAANLVLGGTFQSAINTIVGVALTIYFPIELVACAVLVPVYVRVIKKVLRLDKATNIQKKQISTKEISTEEV